jgi:hypothetical protein
MTAGPDLAPSHCLEFHLHFLQRNRRRDGLPPQNWWARSLDAAGRFLPPGMAGLALYLCRHGRFVLQLNFNFHRLRQRLPLHQPRQGKQHQGVKSHGSQKCHPLVAFDKLRLGKAGSQRQKLIAVHEARATPL